MQPVWPLSAEVILTLCLLIGVAYWTATVLSSLLLLVTKATSLELLSSASDKAKTVC